MPADLPAVSNEKRMAAMLEASGYERLAISQIIGVNVSTVTRWRDQEDYNAEVAMWEGKLLEHVEVQIAQATKAFIEEGMRAIRSLGNIAHGAEFPAGGPDNATRIRAAEVLVDKVHTLLGAAHETQAAGSSNATAVTTIVIKTDGGEVIEGEGEEIIDAPIQT